MKITFQEKPVTLKGKALAVGDQLPEFTLTANDLAPVKKSGLTGYKVFLAVPSLDTGVCDLEVKKFNIKAAELPGVSVYAVSMDLPFAQQRWCGANGIQRVQTLSDYRDHSFAAATGTMIEGIELLTRAVFIIDDKDNVLYAEYVPEITNHPNYEMVYAKLRELVQ